MDIICEWTLGVGWKNVIGGYRWISPFMVCDLGVENRRKREKIHKTLSLSQGPSIHPSQQQNIGRPE